MQALSLPYLGNGSGNMRQQQSVRNNTNPFLVSTHSKVVSHFPKQNDKKKINFFLSSASFFLHVRQSEY